MLYTNKKKVICIIQARLNSSRLPKKVIMDISGKSCIQRVLERVKQSKLIDEIWIATTSLKVDKVLKKISDINSAYFFNLFYVGISTPIF